FRVPKKGCHEVRVEQGAVMKPQANRHSITRLGAVLIAGSLLAFTGCADRAGEAAVPETAAQAQPGEGLVEVVAGAHRSDTNKARDVWRHPVETLTFFGIRPDMTVVELWPFGGWYTEILAPYLRDQGTYYAAAMDPQTASAQELTYNESLDTLLKSDPDLYSKVQVTAL